MAHTGKIVPLDQKTFTLELAEPFGPVLDALGKPSTNVPFMMPARIAATSPDEQLKEIVGSGPFKFVKDEWQPGSQVVYVRNADYVPRREAPSGSTGGKQVHLDRVIWLYVKDPADAADVLAAGDVDWWELPPLDFIPKIEQNPALRTFVTDPLGVQGWLRPNHLHPPFSNRKAREALLHMMDQVTYLHLGIGQAKYYRPCLSVYSCGGAYATKAGAEPIMKHDLDRARQLVKESGYDGRPVVVIHVTDQAYLQGAGPVTQRRLESIGFNVDLKMMDWASALTARVSKDPPGKGGWNILHTWWTAADVINPAVHFGVSGAGPDAWFGWPEVPQLEKLTKDWVRATDRAKRRQLAEEIQKVALAEVTYVPWGEWFAPTAFRKEVQGILKFSAPVFWNVRIA
jgi:peptide/nickel transport system substrate-binding protein